MTTKEFIEQKEKEKLLFTIKPFQSKETCSLWRYELEAYLTEYAEIKLKEHEQKK